MMPSALPQMPTYGAPMVGTGSTLSCSTPFDSPRTREARLPTSLMPHSQPVSRTLSMPSPRSTQALPAPAAPFPPAFGHAATLPVSVETSAPNQLSPRHRLGSTTLPSSAAPPKPANFRSVREYLFYTDGELHKVEVSHNKCVFHLTLDGFLQRELAHGTSLFNKDVYKLPFKVFAPDGQTLEALVEIKWSPWNTTWYYSLVVNGVEVTPCWVRGEKELPRREPPEIMSLSKTRASMPHIAVALDTPSVPLVGGALDTPTFEDKLLDARNRLASME